MDEEDYKSIIAAYQQKAFELFNQNIVLETQINSLKNIVNDLSSENERLKQEKTQRKSQKVTDDF